MRQKDWSIENGRWTFDDDGVATCDCKSTSAHLYYRPLQPRDFDVSVEVQFHGRESSAGILFREQGADFWRDATFYQFEWYTVGSHHNRRLSLMTKNPYWVQIVEPKYPEAPYGRWLRFRVRAEGPRLRCFLDNELVFEKFDNAMVRSGRIGLHVFQPRPVSFRNFQLRALKGSEASVPQ